VGNQAIFKVGDVVERILDRRAPEVVKSELGKGPFFVAQINPAMKFCGCGRLPGHKMGQDCPVWSEPRHQQMIVPAVYWKCGCGRKRPHDLLRTCDHAVRSVTEEAGMRRHVFFPVSGHLFKKV
jgi:hypothetical protein